MLAKAKVVKNRLYPRKPGKPFVGGATAAQKRPGKVVQVYIR